MSLTEKPDFLLTTVRQSYCTCITINTSILNDAYNTHLHTTFIMLVFAVRNYLFKKISNVARSKYPHVEYAAEILPPEQMNRNE